MESQESAENLKDEEALKEAPVKEKSPAPEPRPEARSRALGKELLSALHSPDPYQYLSKKILERGVAVEYASEALRVVNKLEGAYGLSDRLHLLETLSPRIPVEKQAEEPLSPIMHEALAYAIKEHERAIFLMLMEAGINYASRTSAAPERFRATLRDTYQVIADRYIKFADDVLAEGAGPEAVKNLRDRVSAMRGEFAPHGQEVQRAIQGIIGSAVLTAVEREVLRPEEPAGEEGNPDTQYERMRVLLGDNYADTLRDAALMYRELTQRRRHTEALPQEPRFRNRAGQPRYSREVMYEICRETRSLLRGQLRGVLKFDTEAGIYRTLERTEDLLINVIGTDDMAKDILANRNYDADLGVFFSEDTARRVKGIDEAERLLGEKLTKEYAEEVKAESVNRLGKELRSALLVLGNIKPPQRIWPHIDRLLMLDTMKREYKSVREFSPEELALRHEEAGRDLFDAIRRFEKRLVRIEEAAVEMIKKLESAGNEYPQTLNDWKEILKRTREVMKEKNIKKRLEMAKRYDLFGSALFEYEEIKQDIDGLLDRLTGVSVIRAKEYADKADNLMSIDPKRIKPTERKDQPLRAVEYERKAVEMLSYIDHIRAGDIPAYTPVRIPVRHGRKKTRNQNR